MRHRKIRGTILATAAAVLAAAATGALSASAGPAPNATAIHPYALAELRQIQQWSPLLWSAGGNPAPAM